MNKSTPSTGTLAKNLNQPLEQLLSAAANHGEDSGEPDHTVGDLQDLLRAAWRLLTMSQKKQLIGSDAAEAVIEAGARDEFDAQALATTLGKASDQMEKAIQAAGYSLMQGEMGYFWETETGASADFKERADAVEDAFKAISPTT